MLDFFSDWRMLLLRVLACFLGMQRGIDETATSAG